MKQEVIYRLFSSHLCIKNISHQNISECLCERHLFIYLKAEADAYFCLTLVSGTEEKVFTKTYGNNVFNPFKEMKPNAQVMYEKQE